MATRKPLTRMQRLARWLASPAGLKLTHRLPGVAVFAVGAYISYWHIVEVAMSQHERTDSAYLLPVIIDCGLVVTARYISRAKTFLGKFASISGFVVGALSTVACNLLAVEPTPVGWFTGLVPAAMVIFTGASLHWGEMKAKPRKRPVKASESPVKALAASNGHGEVHELATVG